MAKAILLHVILVILAWLIGTAIFGFIPLFIASKDTLHNNFELYQKAQTGFELFGLWVAYRIGAQLFRFPSPRGGMRVAINVTWAVFAYLIIGGTIELAIGHPSLAAGIIGIPVAIILYVLLARQQPKAVPVVPTVAEEVKGPSVPGA